MTAPEDRFGKATRAFDAMFAGTTTSAIYDLLRVGLAAIFLVRHSDWLRPWFFLEHHRFVHGLLFLGSSAAEPALNSPLLLGWPLSAGVNDALVYARTSLAVLLLLGVRVRITAGSLALISFVLLAADRYRYYHHLHLLYVAVACLALTPPHTPFSLEELIRRLRAKLSAKAPTPGPLLTAQPLWPLQLIRALVVSVYLAAGVSKLTADWLRGEALEHLARLHLLGGEAFELARHWLGYGGIAALSCAFELLLPLLLLVHRTRRWGVVVAWAFHVGISISMPVYSFGAQMALLVLAFWPRSRDLQTPMAATPLRSVA